MKPISMVFLCLFAMAPFLLMADIRSDDLARTVELRTHYDAVIDNALTDAAQVLAASVTEDAGYQTSDGLAGDDRRAVDAFVASLSAGLGASSDEAGRSRVCRHVPVLVIMGPNGAVLHACLPVRGADGISLFRPVRLPPVPYAWSGSDGKYLVRFSMGEAVDVTNLQNGTSAHGSWRQWDEDIHELGTESGFRALRTKVVAGVVRDLLESGLEMVEDMDHMSFREDGSGVMDEWDSGNGKGYVTRFNLPGIEDATFRRAVSDVGLLAFVRDLPVGDDRTYDIFAFGGSRLVRSMPLVGYEWESQRFYCREDCPTFQSRTVLPGFVPDSRQWFTSPREAAMAGYRPCADCSR